MHSWITRDLSLPGKLLRSQLNSQIHRYLHFCELFFITFRLALLNQISFAAVLFLEPGPEFRLHDFFFGIPLLFLDLTLPPASPPRSPGPQRHSPLAFSRSRATPGAESRGDQFPLRTEDLKVTILIRLLDTSKWKF